MTTIVIVYCIINAFVTGHYTGGEMQYIKSRHRKVGWFVVNALFGTVFYIIGFPVYIVNELWKDYIKGELQFYYRFYFTNFFENAIDKRKKDGVNMMEEWNKLAKHHKGYTHRKLQRHVALLNKKFKYNPKAK